MEKFGGQTSTEYLQQANDALLTIVQIETREALQNVPMCLECGVAIVPVANSSAP